MQTFEFFQPETIPEVLAAIAESDGYNIMLWGGGLATTLMMKQGLLAPERLVGLRRVAELRGIRQNDAGDLLLGGCTTLRDLERSPLARRLCPALADTATGVGNVRVRNVATVGGHLVHGDPAQDLPPLLLALDGDVRLASAAGERVVPIRDFFVDTMETVIRPDELLTEVRIPRDSLRRRTRYVKYTPRSRDDYATVGVACSLDLDEDGTCREVRIALGGVGATVLRFPEAEQRLVGRPVDTAGAREAAEIVAEQVEPWDDARGSAAYKRAMSRVWTERLLRRLAEPRDGEGVSA